MTKNAINAQFELQTSWFLNALENVSNEESNSAFAETTNPIKWVAGHLVNTRMSVLKMISGKPNQEIYQKSFGKGSSNVIDETYPTLEQIKADWLLISEDLKAAFQSLTEEQLQAKPPFQASIPDETMLGLLAFFAMHESFHIGQLSIYRKLIGKPSMALGKRN